MNLRELAEFRGGVPVFDIEHAKEVARGVVHSCGLTPDDVRMICGAGVPHNGRAGRQTLARKYRAQLAPQTCSACGQPLPRILWDEM